MSKSKSSISDNCCYNDYCPLMGSVDGAKLGENVCVGNFNEISFFSYPGRLDLCVPVLGNSGRVEFIELSSIIYPGQAKRRTSFNAILYSLAR